MVRALRYKGCMWMRYAVLVMGAVLSAGGIATADAQCMYNQRFYGPDAMSCQNGSQARCVDGTWKMTGEQCADQAPDPSGEENQPGVVQPPVGND
jgi:hypothetical protein